MKQVTGSRREEVTVFYPREGSEVKCRLHRTQGVYTLQGAGLDRVLPREDTYLLDKHELEQR